MLLFLLHLFGQKLGTVTIRDDLAISSFGRWEAWGLGEAFCCEIRKQTVFWKSNRQLWKVLGVRPQNVLRC